MLHLRFTPYDISGYTFDFLDTLASRYIVAQEDIEDDGSPLLHYHILIETEYEQQSIRNAAKSNLKIPPAGKGRNNRYYALIADWNDPGYIVKYDNILRQKGFSEKEILDYVISGKKKYLDKVKQQDLPAALPPKKVRVYWDKEVIADAIIFYELAKKKDETPSYLELMTEINRLTRLAGKGINKFKSRDIFYSVLHDTGDAEWVAQKCLDIL